MVEKVSGSWWYYRFFLLCPCYQRVLSAAIKKSTFFVKKTWALVLSQKVPRQSRSTPVDGSLSWKLSSITWRLFFLWFTLVEKVDGDESGGGRANYQRFLGRRRQGRGRADPTHSYDVLINFQRKFSFVLLVQLIIDSYCSPALERFHSQAGPGVASSLEWRRYSVVAVYTVKTVSWCQTDQQI